ncbi:MAG: hypothetical protein R3350_01465 [Saprospiraceae bacterium]|nr:hypothetical protein [Saprospiraceae bacterium]
MLEVSYIRENKERVIEGLKIRNLAHEGPKLIEEIIEQDDRRKETQHKLDQMLAERNKLSREVGDLFKQGKREEGESIRGRV